MPTVCNCRRDRRLASEGSTGRHHRSGTVGNRQQHYIEYCRRPRRSSSLGFSQRPKPRAAQTGPFATATFASCRSIRCRIELRTSARTRLVESYDRSNSVTILFSNYYGGIGMRKLCFVVLLLGSILVAQESNPSNPSQNNSKASKGQIMVQGCVGRSSGDYILTKQDPGMTYQLQVTGKIKLSRYLGQQVEVIGNESPSLRTSSNTLARTSSASVAITITSIKTIEKECSVQ